MDNGARIIWRWLRALRWALWIGFLAYSLEFVLNRASHMNSFGQLVFSTEVVMFGLPLAAVFVGFFEMMARETAGVIRTWRPMSR
jgi:hypothetical protein